jgi:hypothetical protein
MSTIIARLYPDAQTAESAVQGLLDAGMARKDIDIFTAGSNEDLVQAIAAARVSKAAAAAYAERLTGDRTLMVARAPMTPFGLAREAIGIADGHDSIRVAGVKPNEYERDTPRMEPYLSVLRDHPRFMTELDMKPGKISHGPVFSLGFALPLLSEHRPRRSATRGGGFMSTRFLPFPLLKPHRDKRSVMESGRTISSFLGMRLLSRKPG